MDSPKKQQRKPESAGESGVRICLCNPYAEPSAERAPNCPIHRHVSLPAPSPGPWQCEKVQRVQIGISRYIPCFEITSPHDADWIALVQEHHNCIATSGDANARLIAAAPELREALAELLSDYDTYTPDGLRASADKARAVLAKAGPAEK